MNIVVKILMIFVMTLSGTFGAFFLKKAISKLDKKNILNMFLYIELYLGGFSYVFGAVLNIILLKYIDYTVVYPMTALTYIWTLVVSYLLLNEKITKKKLMAMIFIMAGVVLVNI